MEALGLPFLNSLSTSRSNLLHKQRVTHFLSKPPHYRPTSELSSLSRSYGTSHFQRFAIKVQADNEDYELKQAKDMTAARKRWEALVRDEKVKVLTPREAGYAIQLSNKALLDVRPSPERKKDQDHGLNLEVHLDHVPQGLDSLGVAVDISDAWVKGSTWIPIFEVDNRLDAGTISRKVTSFMMGGWWSGVPTLTYDSQFLSKVEEKFPKDTDLIVACQKGLRSLAACELLYNAGYRNLFWVQGGLEASEDEDLVIEGTQPIKFAGIGGISEFLGWTDQQRVQAAREGWGYRLMYSARLVGVFIVADALFLGAQRLSSYIQDLRSH